jgi:hypothetical protein
MKCAKGTKINSILYDKVYTQGVTFNRHTATGLGANF